MKPVQLKNMKRTNFYTPTRKVWFQKNDDSKSAQELINEVESDRMINARRRSRQWNAEKRHEKSMSGSQNTYETYMKKQLRGEI